MSITITEDKKEKMIELVKSFKAIDAAIEPFRSQRSDLKEQYIDNQWLSKEEFDVVKKAYNALKRKVDMDDLTSVIDLVKGEME